MKDSEQISEFLDYLRRIQLLHGAAYDAVGAANKEQQDLLHELEFGCPRYRDRALLAGQLQDLRERRRKAKCAVEITAPICKFAEDYKSMVKALERLLGEVRKIEEQQAARKYIPRCKVTGGENT